MDFLKLLVSFFVISIFYNIVFYFVGKLLFKFGKRKIGHYLIANSIAGDFGIAKKTRQWLNDNCPYDHNCNNCKIWTCGNYSNKHNNIDNTNPH